MMDRNREGRKGTMAAVNGAGGISRRRQQQRIVNLRDSPEEDGAMEMQESSSRLRDRGVKKDQYRDRGRERSSNRSKRRKGERLMHGSNNREGEDSSEESMDVDDEEEEEEASVAARSPAVSPLGMPSSSSSIQQQNHHHNNHHDLHNRKSSFSAKPARPPAASWKVAEEVLGVSIPRKARTSSLKRPQECGGGSGELIHLQPSTSPARQSPSSNRANSPSSSNVSIRKKKISSSGSKHRPPKMVKSPSLVQEIEMEVAEVLFGMTRQTLPAETKDISGLSADAKSRVSSPNSSQPSLVATAPKRKRPRVKVEDESPANSATPSTKMESEMPQRTEDISSSRLENNTSGPPAIENGIGSSDLNRSVDAQQDLAKSESCDKVKEEIVILPSKSNANSEEVIAAAAAAVEAKAPSANKRPIEEKFSIDLMAPPFPEKSYSERDGVSEVSDHKSLEPEKKMIPGLEIENGEVKVEISSKHEGNADHQNAGNFSSQEFDVKKQTSSEKIPNLQLDLEKHDKDGLSLSNSSKQLQVPKQQPKSWKLESKQEMAVTSASLCLPVPVAGWAGGFPQFGYMGQVPSIQAVVTMDGCSGAAKPLQPPPFLQPRHRPKRCATHCYIAQNIHYHQQISRLNPFWPSPAAGATPPYGAKQYNLNAVPASDSAAILGNPLQGGCPPRSLAPLQDKSAMVTSAPKEKSTVPSGFNSINYLEATQRKPFLIQQSPQPGLSTAAPNMMHAPAFIFPTNQQPAAVPNPTVSTSKSILGTANAAPSAASANSAAAAAAGSGAAGHSATTMNFNYMGLSQNDAQYMAILQNNAYPFPIAAPPAVYRGATPAQAMPFFNGPFYSPQMIPSQQQQQQLIQQLQQQQQQQQQHQQQQHHHQQQQQLKQQQPQQQGKPSTSSGSSSSQKQVQQSQRLPGTGAPAASNSNRMHLRDTKDNPSTADSSKASQAQKGLYGQNFVMPQNFALISGGSHSENKQPGVHQQQHQSLKVELTPSQAQAYAMSFATFGGSTAADVPGFDYSAIVQNPALIQNLPDLAKHGYQIPAAAAAAAAVAAQHKKSRNEDGKSRGDSVAPNANAVAEEGNNTTASVAGEGKNGSHQHSLSFSRADNEPTIPNFSSILGGGNHRIPNGSRSLIPPSSSGPSSSTPSATIPPSSQQQQQQQQMIQFHKQQQRIIQLQQQLHQHQQLQIQQQQQSSPCPVKSSSHTTSSTNVSSPSSATRFPLTGFPPSVQSPQWNASARAASTSASASSATSSSSAKNQTPQQQQNQQPLLTTNPHQTQISFGVTSSKSGNSVTGNGGSPRASPSSKPGQQPTLPLGPLRQQQAKNSPTITNTNNRSIPSSILGHPHSNKLNPHQSEKQPHLFFNTPYNIQAQNSQPKAGYYHQQQQQQQSSSSSGMLSLSSSSLTSDPSKAAPKVMTTSMASHPFMSAAFPSNAMASSVSVKPEKKQSITGNDNLHGCWKPEKR